MTCPNCNAPIDDEMKFCIVCGIGVFPSSRKAKMTPLTRFILNNVLLFGGVVIFWTIVFPAGLSAYATGERQSVASRGRDLRTCIDFRDTDLLPKTLLTSTSQPKNAISSRIFTTSTEYFKAIYDEEHVGTTNWYPVVQGFDYEMLSGAGVFACRNQRLTSKNNIWAVAANVTNEDDDRIPVLITRNVNVKEIERIVNHGLTTNDFAKNIRVDSRQPFTKKGYVIYFKGGGCFCSACPKKLGDIFGNQELPPRDPSKPPIVYLMP